MDTLTAFDLATKLMAHYGLQSWTLGFNNCKRSCGRCYYESKRIELSKAYIQHNPDAMIENTIRHEIAHALVGYSHGHDQTWKLQAIACGAKPERCNSDAAIPGKWQAVCNGCGYVNHKHARPRAARICATCWHSKREQHFFRYTMVR